MDANEILKIICQAYDSDGKNQKSAQIKLEKIIKSEELDNNLREVIDQLENPNLDIKQKVAVAHALKDASIANVDIYYAIPSLFKLVEVYIHTGVENSFIDCLASAAKNNEDCKKLILKSLPASLKHPSPQSREAALLILKGLIRKGVDVSALEGTIHERK
ncbi:hypothetical protein HYT84_04755 [Candidatus Micrarchaeota archaeon]|nr:hypothetical protein [Candidatus Micrarchaeota archaeon]